MNNFISLQKPTARAWDYARGFKSVLLLLTITLVYCAACHSQEQVVRSDSPLTKEQLGVYGSLLENLSTLHIKNIANRTIRLDLSDLKQDSACLQGIEPENSVETRRTTHPFGPEFAKAQELTLVDPFQQLKVMEQEEKRTEEPVAGGAKSAPQSSFLIVSEIVFDKTHQYALLKYIFMCGTRCKTSQSFVMAKSGEHWQVNGRPCSMSAN